MPLQRAAGPNLEFPDLAPQDLVIANTAGAITLKFTCPTRPGANTIIRASVPVSQGRETWDDFRVRGTCPVPAAGAADITSLYTARCGVPPAAKTVYVRVSLPRQATSVRGDIAFSASVRYSPT